MKMLEVMGVYAYLGFMILCLSQYSFWMYKFTDTSMLSFISFESQEAKKIALSVSPNCFKNRDILENWAGSSHKWIVIEIIVNLCYVTTMIILLAKSRFFQVGIDNTQ